MSTHIFHAERDADRSGSEISTTDSFIQEFQEFEAQVYSGALFEQKCGTSTPNENINSLPRQANNIPTMRLEPCSRETSANQHLGKHDANKLVKPPDSSHSQSTISKNSEVKKSSTSTIPSRQNLPSRLEFPALKSAANTTTTTDRHHLSSSDFIKAKFSGSNLYFVPNLLSTSDIVGSNRNFYLTTPISDPHLSVQSNSPSNQMNNTRSCNENGVEVEVKSLASLSPSNNNLNLSHQINKINLDSVASYALEDPIQTHDQVVAKMAAEGVVWIPSNASHSTTNTTAAEKTSVRQPMLQKTDQLRWYSEEIEEEKVNKCSVVRRNSVSESYHSMKQNSSTVHNDPTRDNDVNQSHSETAQSPNMPCHSVSNSSNSNFTNSQIGISESSLKQVELEAKLEEAMTIRKQQDDYIKQLQMYYDNLLTKHALAEVTIDQLRMGIRVGIDASKASDTPAHHHTSNKPRSHSMQTIHYNISNRHVSDDSYSQTDGGYHETRNDSSGNNVHYLSTPLLEQQRNRLRRNASTHDARILSTTTDSWETELGSISNSGQIGRRNDTPDMNNYNDKQSVCYSPDRRTIESGNACIAGQNHFRKTSEPSRSSSNDLCSRFHDDSMKTPINWRRNTIVNSCYAGHQEQQQQQQQTQIDLPSSLSRIYKSSVTESHNGCNENEVIIDEGVLENRVTNVSHHHYHHSNNHEKQPNYSKDSKNYYDLAKFRWTQDSQFDANKVLIDEFNDMGSQLDKLESYILNNSERISSPSCSNASSPGALRTPPPPASMSISDLPVNWKDLNMLKQSGQTASGEHNNKPVKNTEDNGVLSSPSSLPSRVDHGRLSSVSPLHSPIVEDSLSELESVYFELMQHYNKIKQLPMTTLRAEQLYNLMKRLYDLALTADNRSSIIASPNELERIFQLDGDTRKLSENLERAIALQEQLCYYQSFHGCESNASSHKEVVPQTNETNDSKVDLLKDNCTNKLSSSVSLSSYSRGHDVQNNKKNSTNSQSFTSSDTSSNQDSGLSTPPESSDGGMMRHDEPDRRHHHHQHYFPPSHQTLKHETLSTNSNSQTDNSSNTPKHSNSDSGLVMHPQTIHSSIQSMNNEHSKSPSNTSSVELKHSVCGNDKQDGMKVVKKKSPVSYSSTQSSSSITKQRINHLENSVRLLKKNLEDLCLKGENGTPNGYVENGIPVMNRKSCQFVSPTFDSRSNLPSSGVNNLDIFAFPHLATSSPILNSNNKSGGVYVSSGQANTSSLSMQDVCEQNLVENSNCTRTILPPGRMYHRALDRRLIMHGQENDSNYSLCSVKPQLKNNQEYVQSKSNQSITRTLFNNNNTNNNNNSRKISHRVNDSRDLNCCRKVNSSQCNNDTIRCSSNGLGCSNKSYSTCQLNGPHEADTCSSSSSSSGNSSISSVSSEYSTGDSPTVALHTSSSVSSSSVGDNSISKHSSRHELNNRLSMPKSTRQRNPLATSSVSKSVIRDDHWKSHNKSYRSSSLCKAQDSCRSALRSVTNIHENYGSLKHLNSIPVKKSVWNTDSNSKFVHNLANKFGGSVPFVANPDISYEPVHLRPVRQQCSRVYTAFDSNQRRPQVPFEPSLYFYPSTERILYSHSVQRAPVHLGSNHGESVLFSPRIPCISKDTSGSCLKTTTCGACGGSGQVVDNCNDTNAASGRLTEPPLIRPNIGLNPLYRKALSSARSKESRSRPLRATHPCDDNTFSQSSPLNLFENDENVCRNVILNSVNASTYYRDLGRIDQSARFGSPSRVNHQTGRSKPINFSSYAHNSSIYPKHSHHSNKSNNSNYFKKINKIRNTDVTYSSEDSNSSSTQIGDKHHSSTEGRRYDYSRQQSKGFRKSSSSTLFPASSALQEILEAASSTSRLAQKLRCSLEDLCKTELK